MSQLLIVILDDLKPLPDLLHAWRKAGVRGATILESIGAYRAENWLSRAGLGALGHLFEADEVRRRTVLTAVDDDLLDEAIAEADRVVGGFDRPNSGILLAVPLSRTLGTEKNQPGEERVLPPAVKEESLAWRETPVSRLLSREQSQPVIVPSFTPLEEVAELVVSRPGQPVVTAVCAVSEDNRLVGLLGVHELADHLFYHIFPEEFLSEVTDLGRVMEFASRSSVRTVAEAMIPPVSVTLSETVKDAFRKMRQHRLAGLPVVDEHHHVIGYLSLIELLAAGARRRTRTADQGDVEQTQ